MSGHGHVTPNPDGSLARCGGPGICPECSRELAAKLAADGVTWKTLKYEKPTIHVLYSCAECGVKDAGVDVPIRGNEDVIQWMNQTVVHIAQDHRQRSPNCHPREFSEIKIPITGAEKVGGPAIQ